MLDWIKDSRSDYVVAAYGVAFVALIALGFESWLKARRARKHWRKLQN